MWFPTLTYAYVLVRISQRVDRNNFLQDTKQMLVSYPLKIPFKKNMQNLHANEKLWLEQGKQLR